MPKLRLLRVPLAGRRTAFEVSALPRRHPVQCLWPRAGSGDFAIMMMLAWRHRLFEIATPVVAVPFYQLVPMHLTVTPAKAGIQSGRCHASWSPGPCLRGSDRNGAQKPSV